MQETHKPRVAQNGHRNVWVSYGKVQGRFIYIIHCSSLHYINLNSAFFIFLSSSASGLFFCQSFRYSSKRRVDVFAECISSARVFYLFGVAFHFFFPPAFRFSETTPVNYTIHTLHSKYIFGWNRNREPKNKTKNESHRISQNKEIVHGA